MFTRFIICHQIFRLKNDFNTSVLALRREKLQCITALWKYHKKLAKLNEELPPEYEKILSPVPEINVSLEYPDRDFQVRGGKKFYVLEVEN